MTGGNGPERYDAQGFLGGIIGSLTLLGLSLYTILRFSYSKFYAELGTAPEEVGLGYEDILSRSAAGVVLFLLAFGIVFGLLFLFGIVFSRLSLRPWMRRRWRRVFWTLAVVAVLAAGVSYTLVADSLADRVRKGNSVLVTQWAGWRAQPAHIIWTSEAPESGNRGYESLIFLGESNGISVFYEHNQGEIFRIPSSSVIVVVRSE